MSPEQREQLLAHVQWAEGTGPVENGRFKMYPCPAGHNTIGWGRNLDANGISKAEAEFLLSNDIADAIADAAQLAPFSELDEARQAVLVDMVFNMGLGRVRRFRRMLAALEAHNYEAAAAEMMDSQWYTQTGRRARKLVDIMRKGQWPD